MAVTVESELFVAGELGLFLDFAYPTKEKFEAPFVGVYNMTDLHKTSLHLHEGGAEVRHVLDDTDYGVYLRWEGEAEISGPEDGTRKYKITTSEKVLHLTASFGEERPCGIPSVEKARRRSEEWWEGYWNKGAFVDLTASESEEAKEVQRRTVQSLYLVAVNTASDLPPQGESALSLVRPAFPYVLTLEQNLVRKHSVNISPLDHPLTPLGLVNNGWHGKFHVSSPSLSPNPLNPPSKSHY